MNQTLHGQTTLLLGVGELSRALEREICGHHRCGFNLVGVVSDQGENNPGESDLPFLGSVDRLNEIIAQTRPARIIVALADRQSAQSARELLQARFYQNIRIDDGALVYEMLSGKVAIDAQAQNALLYSKDFQPSPMTQAIARGISLLTATLGLIVLAPLLLLIAVAIKLDSRGPVLFIQERMGLGCRPFQLIKFRTMHPDRENASEWAADNNHRITRVGRWLRKFRLDELPQFYNLLTSDMNLVGPRPHPASNYELFVLVARNTPVCGNPIPYYSLRSVVRPGITGWAQVRYQYANNLGEEIEKLCFDLYYIKHYSIWLDLQILFATVKVVICGQNTMPLITATSIRDSATVIQLPEAAGRITPRSPVEMEASPPGTHLLPDYKNL